jgi:hypothetical protein
MHSPALGLKAVAQALPSMQVSPTSFPEIPERAVVSPDTDFKRF